MSNMHLFYGGPLSQWHRCSFEIGDQRFTQAEQYMMFKKAELFGDKSSARKIIETDVSRIQKAFGRQVSGFDKRTWEAVAKDIVFRGNMAKFSQDFNLLKSIINTGDDLIVEASPVDTIWGIGLSQEDPDALDINKWRGTNWLGEILTEVRSSLKACQKLEVFQSELGDSL